MTAIDLKVAIIRSGQTQRNIARQLGISENQMSNVVHGLRELTDEQQQNLARVLGQHLGGDPLAIAAPAVLR